MIQGTMRDVNSVRGDNKENLVTEELCVESMRFSNAHLSKSTVASLRAFLEENNGAMPKQFVMRDCDGSIGAVLETVLSSDDVESVNISDGHSLSNASIILSAIGGRLANNHSIIDLTLSIRAPRRICGFGFLSFIGGLRGNENLHSLTFDRCPISDGNSTHLIQALEEHPSLCELNLYHACLTSCDAFVPYLESPYCTLDTLRITDQQPTANRQLRISSLAQAMEKNKSLRTLSLAGNRLDERAAVALAISIATHNETLETFDLSGCDLPDGVVEQILSAQPNTKGLSPQKNDDISSVDELVEI